MLIIALVLALIGLAALVFAVVTSNVLVAWVCIGASALGVLLLIVDALRERRRQRAEALGSSAAATVERVRSERVQPERVTVGSGEEPSAESASPLESPGAATDTIADEGESAESADAEPAVDAEATDAAEPAEAREADDTDTLDDDETPT